MAAVFETERLVLDELAADRDELFVFELLNEPGFLENIGDRGVTDLAGARRYIETGPAASYATNGFGLWRMVEKATGEPVGVCGLIKREGLADPDVGYAVLERFWGRGYAEEAARATLAHGRNALGIGRIVAITTPGNVGSIRVLEKIGLRPEGRIHLPDHGGESAYFVSDA
ncbi:MAG TPA: GNAT family N-acetyltransferase [Phenylobacterium sp.]|nr:GNAT family N-acetyltransferase [Phenylobacterium sp.]